MRRFTCRECQEERPALGLRGPLPTVCEECRPRSHSGAGRIRQLEARIAELEGAMRARLRGEPGREAVQFAVRRLAWAEGREATREALLDLAAEARAWAVQLANSDAEAARS